MDFQLRPLSKIGPPVSNAVWVESGKIVWRMPAWTQLSTHSLPLKFHKTSCPGWGMGEGRQSYEATKTFDVRAACALTKVSAPVLQGPENLEREPHKYFDQVVIVVRSGDGGHGAALSTPRPTMPGKVDSRKQSTAPKKKPTGAYRRGSDGTLILPMGGHGGDIILVANESADTLLPLHRQKRHSAKRGANVDAMGRLSPTMRDGISAPALRVPVPVGTVVKRKRGGKFLADLARPGDEVLVARGGRGGISVVEIPKSNKSHLRPVNAPTITDPDDKVLTFGAPGEEVALELTLRVVADVGLVGLPNAGKSSLLAAVTLAKPNIADYPFTTLMPNLGCIEGDPGKYDGGFSSGPTMADLPGLIKGAHLGKGLGRMFLRHLRRTRLLVHVVDVSAADPVQDYSILREELHLYNPEYVMRPHIVVLNKLDLPQAKERFEAIQEKILSMCIDPEESAARAKAGATSDVEGSLAAGDVAVKCIPQGLDSAMANTAISEVDTRLAHQQDRERNVQDFPRAVAVIGISALQGEGVENLLKQIRSSLEKEQGSPRKESRKQQHADRPKLYVAPQWQL